MLFNSFIFIFAFLPVALGGYLLTRLLFKETVWVIWLAACSLLFYAWWKPVYLILIVASILVNYTIGKKMGVSRGRPKKMLLILGVVMNLGVLAYFKYTNFIFENVGRIIGQDFDFNYIVLPLAISFFTFQQIAYLVDAYRGETMEVDFSRYTLFVTFFPQLIAGPIVHHREMLPQFFNKVEHRKLIDNLAVGLSIFAVGLFKKVVIADSLSKWAQPTFAIADMGVSPTFFESWIGALAYTLQLYFDFSGYSEMALGLGRMFGIVLPINFFSPYKARSIIDFWRRWHITLSRFLRDYLYIPLGGSRCGPLRHHVNLFVTMLLGGLWHGAGWTFVIWGMLHAIYLTINHLWREWWEGGQLGLSRAPLAGRPPVVSADFFVRCRRLGFLSRGFAGCGLEHSAEHVWF